MEFLTIRISGGDRMDTLTLSSRRFSALGSFILALPMLALPTMACGEEMRAGLATQLVGTATVARAALPQPAPLHFKDDVLLKDRITTGESSAVRLLLGGKATITARERSVLTITEIPGTATVRLASGRAAIAVVKATMNPGEIDEIRPPKAVDDAMRAVGGAASDPRATATVTTTVTTVAPPVVPVVSPVVIVTPVNTFTNLINKAVSGLGR